MAKFSGVLGIVSEFSEQTTDGIPNGIFKPTIIEVPISGDLLENRYRVNSNKINDEVTLSNRFSFIVPSNIISTLVYSYATYKYGIYITWYGTKLKISDMQINPPRVTVSTNGIWIEDKING